MINFELVGLRIKSLRRQNNITQEKLSEMLNITTEHLSRIETGTYRPSIKLIEHICQAFDIDEQYLLFGVRSTSDKNLALIEKISILSDHQRKAIEIILDSMKIN